MGVARFHEIRHTSIHGLGYTGNNDLDHMFFGCFIEKLPTYVVCSVREVVKWMNAGTRIPLWNYLISVCDPGHAHARHAHSANVCRGRRRAGEALRSDPLAARRVRKGEPKAQIQSCRVPYNQIGN